MALRLVEGLERLRPVPLIDHDDLAVAFEEGVMDAAAVPRTLGDPLQIIGMLLRCTLHAGGVSGNPQNHQNTHDAIRSDPDPLSQGPRMRVATFATPTATAA